MNPSSHSDRTVRRTPWLVPLVLGLLLSTQSDGRAQSGGGWLGIGHASCSAIVDKADSDFMVKNILWWVNGFMDGAATFAGVETMTASAQTTFSLVQGECGMNPQQSIGAASAQVFLRYARTAQKVK